MTNQKLNFFSIKQGDLTIRGEKSLKTFWILRCNFDF